MSSTLVIEKFKTITRYDIESYLTVFTDFVTNKFPVISSFFSGKSSVPPVEELKFLRQLVKESQRIETLVGQNSSQFTTTDFWELFEMLDDIRVKLETISNLPKWSRVSITKSKGTNIIEGQIVLKQNQSIESGIAEGAGYTDEHNAWYQVALRNDVEEEDYTPENGKVLSVQLQGGLNFNITSVVDIIDMESVKGKDLYKTLTWEDNDLKVLTGNECFLQTVDILLKMYKGDNTEFIDHGLSKDIVAGSNINGVSYPVLVRQLTEQFNSDDSIRDFLITTLERRDDGVFVEFSVTSRSGELFNISRIF